MEKSSIVDTRLELYQIEAFFAWGVCRVTGFYVTQFLTPVKSGGACSEAILVASSV